MVDTVLTLGKWKKYRHTHTYTYTHTHTHTHRVKKTGLKMFQMLESTDDNFKITSINVLKVLKEIWTE